MNRAVDSSTLLRGFGLALTIQGQRSHTADMASEVSARMGVREALKGAAKSVAGLTLLGIERLRTGAVYSPFGAEYWANPYPMYKSLQSRDPCHRSLLAKSWVASRYEDVTAVLGDSRFLVDNRKLPSYERKTAQKATPGVFQNRADVPRSMLTLDPPDHSRLRSLVSKAFSPRSVEALRPRVEAIAHQCLDAVTEAGEMDVISAFAHPLPAIVIAELLGVPSQDHELFKRWSDEIVRAIGYARLDELRRANDALRQLTAYLERIAEERRRNPRDDLLSALLAAEQEGDKLTTQEVVSTCRLLLNAGHAMTTNLIGNGLAALLEHPEQMDALRQDRSLIESVVEELLRYDSPAQATSRFALEEIEMRGRTVTAGQPVVLLLGAANRDPEQFSRPDSFDITRTDNRHLSFGHGIHYCLGAPLARLEAQVAFTALIERFPKLRLATERLDWQHHMLIRGLKTLPVTF